jgi:hypothetical protein
MGWNDNLMTTKTSVRKKKMYFFEQLYKRPLLVIHEEIDFFDRWPHAPLVVGLKSKIERMVNVSH